MQSAPNDHRATGWQERPGTGWRSLFVLLAAAVTLPQAGCSLVSSVRNYITYNDSQNDFVMGFRNNVWAKQAWAEERDCFVGQPQFGSFGAGFRAGYASVAGGGNGCPPAVPPRKYWTWKYQTPEGQAKIAAWFSGFPHGARAAEEDQAGEYQNIPVSYAIEHQYSTQFGNSGFVEMEEDYEPLRQNSLEPLPNPGFVPPVPLDASAGVVPAVQPATGSAMPIGPRSMTVPASFHQPVNPGPPPRPYEWPQ